MEDRKRMSLSIKDLKWKATKLVTNQCLESDRESVSVFVTPAMPNRLTQSFNGSVSSSEKMR